MAFKITFHAGVGEYDARMTREQALNWLRSRGLAGMTNPSTSTETPLEKLDSDRLAQAISAATNTLVEELQQASSPLIIRNEPDAEPRSWVTVASRSIRAVKVTVVDDDQYDDDDDDDDDAWTPFYDPGDRIH